MRDELAEQPAVAQTAPLGPVDTPAGERVWRHQLGAPLEGEWGRWEGGQWVADSDQEPGPPAWALEEQGPASG